MSILDRFRDPVSGLTHLVGAGLGACGLVYMATRTIASGGSGANLAAVLIYGVSLVLLYLASATYHLLIVPDGTRLLLRRIDHAIIPVFIAGTYTPFCVIALKGTVGTAVLVTIWALALGGMAKSIFWIHAPRWLTAGLFVLMGWVVVAAAYQLYQSVSPLSFWLVFGGGVLYSIGALVYSLKWPDPFPPHFGFHEIWHLFVLAGSTCHYFSILELPL